MSSERVREQTGRGWPEWIDFLDAKSASKLDHKAIVAIVFEELQKPWWSQMVTVGYEQAKGLRLRNQSVGGFQVSVSKTFSAPLAQVFGAWNKSLDAWYAGPAFEITTNNQNKNIRAKLEDDSNFEVRFLSTSSGKTQLTVDHGKLPTATAAEAARRTWREQLEALAKWLAS